MLMYHIGDDQIKSDDVFLKQSIDRLLCQYD